MCSEAATLASGMIPGPPAFGKQWEPGRALGHPAPGKGQSAAAPRRGFATHGRRIRCLSKLEAAASERRRSRASVGWTHNRTLEKRSVPAIKDTVC